MVLVMSVPLPALSDKINSLWVMILNLLKKYVEKGKIKLLLRISKQTDE